MKKKVYSKPKVEAVRLVTDEVVLAACKTTGQSGPPALADCGVGGAGACSGES